MLPSQQVAHLPTYNKMPGYRGYVYILQDQDGFCKIGQTTNPAQRFKQLEKKYRFAWRLIAIFPSRQCWRDEGMLHTLFKSMRRYGTQDWFWFEQHDIEYIRLFMECAE
jgi:hypothetical protein